MLTVKLLVASAVLVSVDGSSPWPPSAAASASAVLAKMCVKRVAEGLQPAK